MNGQALLQWAQSRHVLLGAPSSCRLRNVARYGIPWTTSSPYTHLRRKSSMSTPSRRRSRLAPSDLNIAKRAPAAGFRLQKGKRRNNNVGQNLQPESLNTIDKIKARDGFPTTAELSEEYDYQGLLANPRESLRSTVSQEAEAKERAEQIGNVFQTSLAVNWRNGAEPLTAVGHAPNLKASRSAAWLDLVYQLHQRGQLKSVLPYKITKLDDSQRSEEKKAMEDVYNYCARYDHFPVITCTKGLRARRKVFRTQIVFPHHDIDVRGVGTSQSDADTVAAIHFKQAAEKHHIAQGTDSLVVREGTSLNLDNVEKFWKFYSMKHPGAAESVQLESVAKNLGSHGYQLLLGGQALGETVYSNNKRTAAFAAKLAGALEIVKQKPNFKDEFLTALKSGNGNILTPITSWHDFPIDNSALTLMRNTLSKARSQGLDDQYQPLGPEDIGDGVEDVFHDVLPNPAIMARRNQYLKRARDEYETSAALADMRRIRQSLPMNAYRAEVLDIVNQNQYSIIIGETGSGKTTQVPQILLDHYSDKAEGTQCNVICTQPRRIAATSVAQRVAAERGEPLKSAVGYQIRGDSSRNIQPGGINFCTTGILVTQLQGNPDAVMDRVSHIIIDEVHERDKAIDYLMIMLRQVIASRAEQGKSTPKVVLMSATVDPTLFAPYFKNAEVNGTVHDAPVLRVPGRTFPVTEKYLEKAYSEMQEHHQGRFTKYVDGDVTTSTYLDVERQLSQNSQHREESQYSALFTDAGNHSRVIDWKRKYAPMEDQSGSTNHTDRLVPTRLVAATIAHIAKTTQEGAILVFLPGWDEIATVEKHLLQEQPLGVDFTAENKYIIFNLHSSVSESQQTVFEAPPAGKRKIILSTNIAETSVTIPDVQYVVDTGKCRENTYDQIRRLSALTCTWISKSNAKQRAGRAGRVQNGHYYALFTKARHESLRVVGLPEILRTDLQETCLEVVSQRWPTPTREFLADAIEPPDPEAVNVAMQRLVEVDALTPDEHLTPLGRLLSTLPVHPELGKMVVMGIIFRCLDPMIILGAAAGSRSLFTRPLNPHLRKTFDDAINEFAAGTDSDHIAMLNAFREVRALRRNHGFGLARDFAHRHGIHWGAFTQIDTTAGLIEDALVHAKLIPAMTTDDRVSNQYGTASLNTHSKKPHIVKALVTAGLYPRLAMKPDKSMFHWRTQHEAQIRAHPSSVNAESGRNTPRQGPKQPVLAVFDSLVRSADGSHLNMRNTTLVSPMAVALFCGSLAPANTSNHRAVTVDQWLPFYCQSDDRLVRRTLIEVRKAIERMLVRAYADLSKRTLLTEDPARSLFAENIVNVLTLDSSRNGPVQMLGEAAEGAGNVFDRMQSSRAPSNSRADIPRGSLGARSQPAESKKTDEGISLSMLEWAAKWEAKARAKRELSARNRSHL